MFLYFLFISQFNAYSTIELDQQLQWKTNDKVTIQNIYFIPKNEQQQYYVNVSLEQQDPEFYLIITLGQQFNPNNNTTITYFDWISQIENRLTRFIKIQPQGQDIYIETIGNITQQYNISVIATNNNICPNDCNNHGICQENNVCQCDPSYVGNDCHQSAKQILLNEENQLGLIADQLYYFYISVDEQKKQDNNLTLALESNNPNKTILIFESTEVLFLPENNYWHNKSQFYNETNVDINNPQKLSIQIDNQNPQPIVLLVKSLGENSILIINKNRDEGMTTTTIIIVTVCPIAGVGLIIAIVLIIWCCKRNSRELSQRSNGSGLGNLSPGLKLPTKEIEASPALSDKTDLPPQKMTTKKTQSWVGNIEEIQPIQQNRIQIIHNIHIQVELKQ